MAKNNVDLILYNGLIWTGDATLPQAEAVAVQNGRIAAVGSDADILQQYSSASMCNLGKQRLLPGLHDSHMHLINTGTSLRCVNLVGCASISELVSRFSKAEPVDGMLLGRGFLHDTFSEGRMPTCHDLDKVSTEIPVCAVRACGHIAVVNSKLLQMAGIVKGFGQVDGGEIGYDVDGEPSGMLAENALGLVYRLMPEPSVEELQAAISAAAAALVECGITTAHSDDFGSEDWDKTLAAFIAARDAGKLPLRLNHQMRFAKPEDVERFGAWRQDNEALASFNTERFTIGPVKLMCDGSLGGRTAAMSEPYADAPETSGVPILSREEMAAILRQAHQAGYQLSGHAIGDKAISDLIEAMAIALDMTKMSNSDLAGNAGNSAAEVTGSFRPRVIHAQITTPAILQRMQQLGVHCDIQPAFVPTDSPILTARVGGEKAATSYAWKTMRNMGITTSGGSDSPVESYNPFYGIYCAVTRQDMSGAPHGGWTPTELLSVDEALQLYTSDAAYAVFNEENVGRITLGQYADFVLIDRDILTVPLCEIKAIQVLSTWIAGEVVYKREG